MTPVSASTPLVRASDSGVGETQGTASEPQSPLVIQIVSPKSALVASYLEFLFPGAGMIYAKQYGLGVACSLATLVAVPWAVYHYFQLVSDAIRAFSIFYGINFSGASAFLQQAIVALLIWTAVRILLAISCARQYNANIAAQQPVTAIRG